MRLRLLLSKHRTLPPYLKILAKISVKTKAIIAVPGKIKIQLRTISPALPQRTWRKLLAAPQPIIAVAFTVPLDTGRPKTVARMRPKKAEISVANPRYLSNLAMPDPMVLMMDFPPTKVPQVIKKATGRTIQGWPKRLLTS